MFTNFIVITLRNLWKNKSFVIINVFGLGIALACCIVSFYNNKYHADFDQFHQKKESIYKVSLTREVNNRQQPYGITPVSLAPAMGKSVSGVREITRVSHSVMPVRYKEQLYSKRIAFADSNFLDVFDFELLAGNKRGLHDERNVFISEEFAGICFGSQDPVGEMVQFYNDAGEERTLIVVGIFTDIPMNSSMQFDLLCPIPNFLETYKIDEHDWKAWVAATFVVIPRVENVAGVQEQLQDFVTIQNGIRDDWRVSTFFIEPLADIPTTNREYWSNWLFSGLHPAQRIAPPLMAMLILLLACLNFTNTALAISSRRLKEIGLRKVFGGVRKQTIIQFLGENILLCFIALLASLLIGLYLVDAYSSMWPYMDLSMRIADWDFWLFLVVLLLVTGIVAGAYPAFYVSRFNPIRILKGDIRYSAGGLFSKVLLVFQFTLAICGIVCAVIFTQNALFQERLYMGYDKDNVIGIPLDDAGKLEQFRDVIVGNPGVLSVGQSEEHLGWGNYSRTITWGEEEEHEVELFDIGKGYFETMGLQLVEGRHFDQEFRESERGKAVVVNEKFVEDFGWESAVGQKIRESDTLELTVVGVMKNFYPYGFWSKISPTILKLGKKDRMRMLVVRGHEDQLPQLNTYLQTAWEKLIPNSVYPGFFQDELLKEARDINKQIKNIFLFLAIVSVILSLVGLYTLVSLKIIKKTREIGIRKVLGAPLFKLINLINREFLIILSVASVFGSAMGYYLSDMLLSSIWTTYLNISFTSFLIPVVFIFVVALLTLSSKVYRAAVRNPVESIKYE